MKPARDIEVGDRITRTDRRGTVESIVTVAEVLSRRGRVRRVRLKRGQELALHLSDNGIVREHSPDLWAVWRYRREEPGDVDALRRARDVNRLHHLARAAMFDSWPIEDVRRVLAAWPGEKK